MINKIRTGLFTMLIVLVSIGTLFTFVSCKKDLKIQQDFLFEVEVMPVPKEIANNSTIEIRVTIKRTGNYAGTGYFIRYFQYDGVGQLKYYDDPSYQPNDLYPLQSEQFRLYYTSLSTVSQSFSIWISDSFGNEKEVKFEFNSKD
ncbi:DUF3872 domain-containing protein [uncultured Dysgonomonas sp.]|nr:DUF3872 domain-containing protein [uncultured Dysgonomonas sp.]